MARIQPLRRKLVVKRVKVEELPQKYYVVIFSSIVFVL